MEGISINAKYEIGKFIAKGGFSKVYKVHCLDTCEKVETKELLASEQEWSWNKIIKIATSPEYSFGTEAAISKDISQDNRIVSSLDYGQIQSEDDSEENYDYIICREIKNRSLLDYARIKKVNENYLRYLLIHMIRALEIIHTSGYAHLDFKLSNILLDENYIPWIVDFGLSHRTDVDITLIYLR